MHTQRIPANVKDVIIGDINGDGSCELVISLTDRVVRTYRWLPASPAPLVSLEPGSLHSGRLVSINKWEFASQIGTVTLNYEADGSPALLGESHAIRSLRGVIAKYSFQLHSLEELS